MKKKEQITKVFTKDSTNYDVIVVSNSSSKYPKFVEVGAELVFRAPGAPEFKVMREIINLLF